MDHPNPFDPNDPYDPAWVLPLHGTEVPGGGPAPNEPAPDPFLRADDEVPSNDFQPRLSRFGEVG